MIQTLMTTAPHQIEWVDLPVPTLGPTDVRTLNRYGTEKHGTMQAIVKAYGDQRGKFDDTLGLYFGTGVAWTYPLTLGNMNYGTVVAVGSEVTRVHVGETVAFSSPFQRESFVAERECFVVPESVDWKTSFLQDPGEFALGAIRDGGVRLGDHVAVFSLGAIGLTTIQMLRRAGAGRIIGVDPIASRRDAALKCGADAVIDALHEDVGWEIRQLTRREGIDVVIDFSGAIPAMQAAFRALAPLGTLVLGAYPNATTGTIDFGRESHANQLNIVFTRACSAPLRDHPRWDWWRIRREVWDLIGRGGFDGNPIVDDPVPFDTLLEAYPRIANAPHETIKLSVVY